MQNPLTSIAIVSALPEEQQGLLEQLQQSSQIRHARRIFWRGQWAGQQVVMALSGIGKVAAASTAAALIENFGIKRLLFTGVAAGIGAGVNPGDVVVANAFVQHDMNAQPLVARYEIPGYGRAVFKCDALLTDLLLQASRLGLATVAQHSQGAQPAKPVVHLGLIATGDQFVNNSATVQGISDGLRQAGLIPLALEMEGAAVAQVCFDYGIAFAGLRTISDRADTDAYLDFSVFVKQVASPYALAILQHFMPALPQPQRN